MGTMTELDLVTGLRRTVHARSVRGSARLRHDHHRPDFPLSYASVTRVEDRKTMLCGGIAYWLYHVYRSLGFQTFVMNTGARSHSHVMTFVRIAHEERNVWCLQDAYLNMTYLDQDGKPLCLTEIYRLLAQRQYEKIVASVSPGLAPVSLRQLELDERRFNKVKQIAARQGIDIKTPSEEIVYLEWNYDSFPSDGLRTLVRSHFGSDSLALLLALPLGTSGEPYAHDFTRIAEDVYQRIRVTP
jgi:hypothetical protein